jgi:hypothetical protein
METSRRYKFANERTADIVQVDRLVELPEALQKLEIQAPRPTLVLVGGASGISDSDKSRLEQLFVEAIAPLAEELGVIVVDGGTDAGIMSFIGRARSAIGATFPLIGVAAIGTIVLPDQASLNPDAAPLEPHHTHFILVPGSNWGDESPWLSHTATVLSSELPSVTLVVNGGEITFQDVRYSVLAERPAIALDGTGRTADKLAAALRGEATDLRATQLAASGKMQAINLSEHPDQLAEVIRGILSQLLHS